jgi:glycogen synthase
MRLTHEAQVIPTTATLSSAGSVVGRAMVIGFGILQILWGSIRQTSTRPRWYPHPMEVLLLTNEFPPTVYGGAGVHVAELTRALRGRVDLDIRTFGSQAIDEPGWRVHGYPEPTGVDAETPELRPVMGAFGRCRAMAADPTTADLVHCHTWYTHLAGTTLHARGLPLVVTAHSLEPLRPWKREQLGAGYELAAAVEREALETADAVIAVSAAMAADIESHFAIDANRIHVIANGIDADAFQRDPAVDELTARGIDPARPYILFVGRVTRQKGLSHLLDALPHLDPALGVVLAAGQADTPELAEEVERRVAEGRRARSGQIHWLPEMIDHRALVQLYSHAAAFVCPSVYEPFGITNLEAMACGTPVVATRTGGIPDVVTDGLTGLLVDPPGNDGGEAFAVGLAAAINRVVADPVLAQSLGRAGRERSASVFSWSAVAERTIAVYRSVA